MVQERKFVKEGIRRMEIEEFLEKEFSRAGYSHSEIQRTPLAMRILIYAHKPGLIIGRGGKNIEAITKVIKEKFGFENPQLDVQEIENPNLDPNIIVKQIVFGIERGLNYKRVANMTLERIMSSGAVGVAIRIGGKVGGEMARTEKFSSGYLKFAGDPAETIVKRAYGTAKVKLGAIGIQVRILTELPKERESIQKLYAIKEEETKEEEIKEEEIKEEEAPIEKPKEVKEEPKKEKKKEEKKNGDNKKKATKRAKQ